METSRQEAGGGKEHKHAFGTETDCFFIRAD